MSQALVGIDVGASGSRLRLVAADGTIRDTASGVGAIVSGGAAGVTRLGEALVGALASRLGPGDEPAVVAIGAAAVLALGDAADALPPLLGRRFGTRRVLVASDAITSYLGAMGTVRPDAAAEGPRIPAGAVVAAGTGAIAMGYDESSGWRRVDGWGYLLGDEGSGAWVGMAGIRAAMRAFDGRPGGSAELLRRLVDAYGPPDELPAAVYPFPDRAARVAAFARQVAEAAAAGDGAALAIWRDAGRSLGEAAAAALPPAPMAAGAAGGGEADLSGRGDSSAGATGLDDAGAGAGAAVSGVGVSWVGGLFDVGDLLLAPFRETVTRLRPDARPRPPLGTSLDGAVALARLAASGGVAPVPEPWARDYVL